MFWKHHFCLLSEGSYILLYPKFKPFFEVFWHLKNKVFKTDFLFGNIFIWHDIVLFCGFGGVLEYHHLVTHYMNLRFFVFTYFLFISFDYFFQENKYKKHSVLIFVLVLLVVGLIKQLQLHFKIFTKKFITMEHSIIPFL